MTNIGVLNFLEFPKDNEIFKLMAEECIDVLLNIEIIFKNKLELDKAYHKPDDFIINCNNIVRNLIFTYELAKCSQPKPKYRWFYDFYINFNQKNLENIYMFTKLRDKSMHNKFIIPDGSFTFGLYKILNETTYIQKIGLGDINQNNNLPTEYIYKETESFFHKLLICHHLLFMDNEHSAYGECLGITRKWNYNVKYKIDGKNVSKTIDIYKEISVFTHDFLNSIILSFCKNKNIKFEELIVHIPENYNFINTILEIDLYPNLFNKFWNGKFKPLNWKYLNDYVNKEIIDLRYKTIEKLFELIPKNIEDYCKLLKKYIRLKFEDFKNQEEYNSFIYFISFPHWFINSINKITFFEKFNFDLIFELQKKAEYYIINIDQNIDKYSNKEINNELSKIKFLLKSIYNELNKLNIKK